MLATTTTACLYTFHYTCPHHVKWTKLCFHCCLLTAILCAFNVAHDGVQHTMYIGHITADR